MYRPSTLVLCSYHSFLKRKKEKETKSIKNNRNRKSVFIVGVEKTTN